MATPTKLEGPWIFGEPSGGQGNRSDLRAVKRAIDSGAATATLWDQHFASMVRYNKSFKEYKRQRVPARNWPMEVIVIFGPPGSGKTRWAMDNHPGLYKLPCPKSSGTYWDDYDGQETVLVDEMYGHYFSWSFLLQLTDRYPMTVPVHGGAGHQFVSRRIIFTSNSPPETWYAKPTTATQWNDANPFRRRVTRVIQTGAIHVPPEENWAEIQPAGDDFEEFIAAAFDFLE